MDIIKINICVLYYFQFVENFTFTLKYIKYRLLNSYSFSKVSEILQDTYLRLKRLSNESNFSFTILNDNWSITNSKNRIVI